MESLADVRLKPVPVKRGCCLFGTAEDTSSSACGCCLTGKGSISGQAGTAFLIGPGIGIPFSLFATMMMYDNPTEFEIYTMALGCYVWSPVGSYIGTMLGGRMFNPGGSWNYTLIGTLLGQAANLILAEGYRIVVGANPWRGDEDLGAMIRGPGKGVYTIIPIASVLPTVGAVVGYNLSLRHAQEEDMGYHPNWSEQVAADLSTTPFQATGTEIASFTLGF